MLVQAPLDNQEQRLMAELAGQISAVTNFRGENGDIVT